MNRDEYFMEMALGEARIALEAGEFPVGCVIVHKDKIVASGRRNNSNTDTNELDHAEMVAFRQLLITHKNIAADEITVYSTMEPCLMCFSTLLVNGVRDFVYSYEDVMGGGMNLPLKNLAPLYSEMKILVTKEVLREKSIELFKRFFSSPDLGYLQGTLLATYTLKQ